MGYLLKEALKTLCGVNRWSYAVFWKIGCQNSRLLIWEESFHEPLPCSVPPHGHDSFDSSFGAVPREDLSCRPLIQSEDKLQSLINRMMDINQICLVGEGTIGRAAFTGNYQWFLSNSYTTDVHPPEVSNEMHHQFSAGIQTVAVIPVSPHGVVQLGSSFSIVENLGFVNDVKSLILQLGCIPGTLFSLGSSENSRLSGYPGKGLTDTSDVCRLTTSNYLVVDSCKQLSNSSYCSRIISGQSNSLDRKIQHSSSITSSASRSPLPPLQKTSFYPRGQVERGEVRAEVIRSNPDKKLNQYIVSGKVYPGGSLQAGQDQLCVQRCIQPIEKQMPVALGAQNLVNSESSDLNSMITSGMRRHSCSKLDSNKTLDGSRFCGGGELLSKPSISILPDVGFQTGDLTELKGIPLFSLSKQLMAYPTEVLSGGSDQINHPVGIDHPHLDSASKSQRMGTDSTLAPNLPWTYPKVEKPCPDDDIHVSQNLKYEDSFERFEGDGLFDILGMDMKNEIFGGRFGSPDLPEFSAGILKPTDIQEADQDLHLVDKGLSDGGFFSTTGNDHLLDAVVSGAHSASKQNSDDSLSCKSTLTRISSSSQPSSSLAHCQSDTIGKVQEDSFRKLGPLAKEGTLGSGSLRSECTKNNEAACSEGNSLCSQIRAWTDQSHVMKRDNSILAPHSEGLEESTKPSRKRLKLGENPKPRPKDRQMIQDRLKELRDIVPNGGKCSIDALLERTVKHMLFLQGVRKHADKLGHIGESRMMDKEGRVFLKDNFEGGATWAYEIGSQSMACPIIVEDLNPPRQLLVEMLCDDRGFFLEIADMIRTLGLTILTGVMESRNGNIWARFAVEANRDVTRMEVFMSLVQALEEIMKGDSVPESAMRNHLMPHHSFAGSSSVPVTGMPSSVQ